MKKQHLQGSAQEARKIGPVKITWAFLLFLSCFLPACLLSFTYFAGRSAWSIKNPGIWDLEYPVSRLEKSIKEYGIEEKIDWILPVFRERNSKMVSISSTIGALNEHICPFSSDRCTDQREDYLFRLEDGTWHVAISYKTVAYGNVYYSWTFYRLGSWIDALFYRIGTDIRKN